MGMIHSFKLFQTVELHWDLPQSAVSAITCHLFYIENSYRKVVFLNLVLLVDCVEFRSMFYTEAACACQMYDKEV